MKVQVAQTYYSEDMNDRIVYPTKMGKRKQRRKMFTARKKKRGSWRRQEEDGRE